MKMAESSPPPPKKKKKKKKKKYKKAKNTVGKEEIARFEQFLLFHSVFKRLAQQTRENKGFSF